jgi:polyphosphate kinase 2 (PPK2 family)
VVGNTRPARLVSKRSFKGIIHRLQDRLSDLQARVRDSERSVLIALEGPDESGKSTIAGRLLETLDPRGFKVWHTYAAEAEELARPWLWRFWMRLPRRGAIACFDRSWYGRMLVEQVERITSKAEGARAGREIGGFERTLADGGAVIVKLLLHLSKREQRRRFEESDEDPNQRWRIKREDWRRHRRFDDYEEAFQTMVAGTSSRQAPWRVIPADDRRTTEVLALRAIANAVARGLGKGAR